MHQLNSASSSGPIKSALSPQSLVIRLVGDSGDGMQLIGSLLADSCALAGNDIRTLPDFPSEIRAPGGSIAGVSGYQVQIASQPIFTPGDLVDLLVALNPAALKTNLTNLKPHAILLVNSSAFTPENLSKANYSSNPLTDNSLKNFQILQIPLDELTLDALKDSSLVGKNALRCKNFLTLGLLMGMFNLPLEPALAYIREKFASKAAVADANLAALRAGFNYVPENIPTRFLIGKAPLPPGTYRKITGNEAAALGLVTAAQLAGKNLFYGSYPITPATSILENLASFKNHNVVVFQAEDEIAAMAAAVGAAYAGAIASTGTSGPGMALKTEAIGLAVMAELPVVIINVQRGGPSTGLPTKPEQSDLFQAVLGRNGDCPVAVLCALSPTDCFNAAIEAVRIAVRYRTPVILLTDGFIGSCSAPWLIPQVDSMEKIPCDHPTSPNSPKGFMPYTRNEDLARPWAIPGVPGLEHRIGGLEKQDGSGAVSHDPANHQKMTDLRMKKIANIQPQGDAYVWTGPDQGEILLVGWGGSHGALKTATLELQQQGKSVANCQIRYLNPLPKNLGDKFKKFKKVIVCELNAGQLQTLLKAEYGVETQGLHKVTGQPLFVHDILEAI